MKRNTPLTRRTALRAKKGLGPSASDPKPRKPLKTQNKARADKAWVRAFHSQAFLDWIHEQPCVRCGQTPSEPHHEPTLGSHRGDWKQVSPLCTSCHTSGPGARHGPNSGVETFWAGVGVSYEDSNRATHMAWLAHIDSEHEPEATP